MKHYSFTKKDNFTTFYPNQIANIYQIGGNPSKRVDIAVIELGGGYLTTDLNNYWNKMGLKIKPIVSAISVDGGRNIFDSVNGASGEVMLDIEIIGGICPNSNILVYFAPNSEKGFYNAIKAAVNRTPQVSTISISWGASENNWSPQMLSSFNSLFQQAAQKGINVCCASGDNGSSDGEKSGLHTDFPGSSPWVVCCGGTSLVCPNLIYNSPSTKETVWNNNPTISATGGGYSSVFPIPSYQTGLNKNKFRGVPDISGDADPRTGWNILIQGRTYVFGGTSCVSPMMAAYLAGIGFKKFLNPLIYKFPSGFHDIISGNNGAYKASPGWDPTSGMGSPNGSVLTAYLLKQ